MRLKGLQKKYGNRNQAVPPLDKALGDSSVDEEISGLDLAEQIRTMNQESHRTAEHKPGVEEAVLAATPVSSRRSRKSRSRSLEMKRAQSQGSASPKSSRSRRSRQLRVASREHQALATTGPDGLEWT